MTFDNQSKIISKKGSIKQLNNTIVWKKLRHLHCKTWLDLFIKLIPKIIIITNNNDDSNSTTSYWYIIIGY